MYRFTRTPSLAKSTASIRKRTDGIVLNPSSATAYSLRTNANSRESGAVFEGQRAEKPFRADAVEVPKLIRGARRPFPYGCDSSLASNGCQQEGPQLIAKGLPLSAKREPWLTCSCAVNEKYCQIKRFLIFGTISELSHYQGGFVRQISEFKK